MFLYYLAMALALVTFFVTNQAAAPAHWSRLGSPARG